MQKYHMPNLKYSLFFNGQNRGRKGRKLTPSDEPTVPSVHSVRALVHCATTGVNLISSDESTVPFLVTSDELEKRSCEDSSVG
jgi:hypothetical protein